MTTHPPGWRPLEGSPGFYVDGEGTLHVDAPEALKANGYRPTAANVATLEAEARAMAARIGATLAVHQ